jgi:ssDNA-binding Zn-finger/Zn-ribbon topoisomerase 1
MKIKETEVKVFLVHAACENCNYEMICESSYYLTHPPQYKYTCPKCNYTETSQHHYPDIVYKYIDEE